jgi:hypothetical protein
MRMLFQTRPRVEELLVEFLAAQPGAGAAELQQKLARRGRRCSFQAVYKALAKLERAGVAVKVGREYGLKFSWAQELLALAERVRRTHFEPALSRALLPPRGESRVWHFTSLLKMDDYWAHLVLRLFHLTRAKVMYEWIPHPWFEMVHPGKEDQFRQALRRGGSQLHMIIGGETFLDGECGRHWSRDIYRFSFAVGPFDERRTEYFDLIENFILTLKISREVSRQIDGFFERVRGRADFDLVAFARIITQPTRASIKLENNQAKAERLRKRFVEYFGER